MMISPFALMGSVSSYMKFFPSFEEKDHNKLFTFLVSITSGAILLLFTLSFVFTDAIAKRFATSAPDYANFLLVAAIIMASNTLFELLFGYSRKLMKAIFPSLLREIYLRMGSLLLVLGISFDWWGFEGAVVGLGLVYASAFLILLVQLVATSELKLDFGFAELIDAKYRVKIFRYGGYFMLLGGGFAIYNNASYDQVTALLGPDANAVFQTCFFMAVIVEMPRRSMTKVLTPIVSATLQKNDLEQVKHLYQRASITMTIIGTLLFIGIATNIQDLFEFIPKGESFRNGYWVVIFVCMAKLAVMAASFSGEIINFSPRYRFSLFNQLATCVTLLLLNYFLIPVWGITGAGIAFLVSTLVNIALRFSFVAYYYKMYPITFAHLKLLGVGLVVATLALLIQPSLHPVMTIAIRSIVTTLAFVPMVYLLHISTDFNGVVKNTLELVKRRLIN